VLLQDRASACIMLVAGGQYKCWRGYTAASISPDGRYALLLGNRASDKDKKSDKKSDRKSKKKKKEPEPEPEEDAEAEGDEHVDEPVAVDDVAVAPPSGPVSLYRAQLEGAYTKSPALVARVVEGAAVWVPSAR
jgi:hypothetical protein